MLKIAQKMNLGFIEFFKYLTTISTGAVVLGFGLLEKPFPNAVWKPLLACSLVGYLVSIILCLFLHLMLLGKTWMYELPDEMHADENADFVGSLSLYPFMLAAIVCFLGGVGFMGLFSIMNILR
jgi:hypothetical protein